MEYIVLIILSEVVLLAGAMAPIRYGVTLLGNGQLQKAIPIFRAYYAACRLLPRWRGPIAGFLAASYAGLGECVQALPYAEEAVVENERYGYTEHLAYARAHLSAILIQLGDFERAERLIDATLRSAIPPRQRVTVELVAANGYLHLDRLDEAERLVTGVLTTNPPRPETQILALTALSSCHFLQGRTEESLDVAQKAAKLKAPTPVYRFHILRCLLICLTELNRLNEAQDIATQLAQLLNSLNAVWQGAAFRVLAELALKQGDLDKARDYAERSAILGTNPNAHANTLLIEAEVFAARHNTHRALTLCRDILQTKSISYYKNRAMALVARLDGAEIVSSSVPNSSVPTSALPISSTFSSSTFSSPVSLPSDTSLVPGPLDATVVPEQPDVRVVVSQNQPQEEQIILRIDPS